MRFTPCPVFLILLYSCGATTTNNQTQKNEDWQKDKHEYLINTYNQKGLLDSSYKTLYWYQKGILFDSLKSVVVRKYHNNRLIDKQEYILFADSTKSLSNELIQQYDEKGNLILVINKMSGDIISKSIMKYNNKNQIVEAKNLFQKMNDSPNDYNLDSAVVHRNDKKKLQYDTTITSYEYDSSGKEIRSETSDTRGTVQHISISEYSGNDVVFSFDLTPQYDTLSVIRYQKEGNLIKHIAELRQSGSVDTTWLENGKIIKHIGHNSKMNMKYKMIFTYNDKGDEIENISYR